MLEDPEHFEGRKQKGENGQAYDARDWLGPGWTADISERDVVFLARFQTG